MNNYLREVLAVATVLGDGAVCYEHKDDYKRPSHTLYGGSETNPKAPIKTRHKKPKLYRK